MYDQVNTTVHTLAEVERNHILTVLELTKGNRTKAAQVLDIGVRTIQRKLKEYGVPPRTNQWELEPRA